MPSKQMIDCTRCYVTHMADIGKPPFAVTTVLGIFQRYHTLRYDIRCHFAQCSGSNTRSLWTEMIETCFLRIRWSQFTVPISFSLHNDFVLTQLVSIRLDNVEQQRVHWLGFDLAKKKL